MKNESQQQSHHVAQNIKYNTRTIPGITKEFQTAIEHQLSESMQRLEKKTKVPIIGPPPTFQTISKLMTSADEY